LYTFPNSEIDPKPEDLYFSEADFVKSCIKMMQNKEMAAVLQQWYVTERVPEALEKFVREPTLFFTAYRINILFEGKVMEWLQFTLLVCQLQSIVTALTGDSGTWMKEKNARDNFGVISRTTLQINAALELIEDIVLGLEACQSGRYSSKHERANC
jgi:hypothetical protein